MNSFVQAGGAAFSSDKMDWETPKEFFDNLNKEYHFTLDPAASSDNAKCKKYYTESDDGLSKDWQGERVFVNPPYGRQIPKWVEKAYFESMKPDTLVVMLLPARTDTRWFHKYIYHKAHIEFLKGRLHFENHGIPGQAAPFPSMIVVFGKEN